MSKPELAQRISEDLSQGNIESIREALSNVHPSEIASILQNFDPDDHTKILEALDNETASEVILELDPEQREDILEDFDADKIADIADEMDSDDAADLLGELPEQTAQSVLDKMDPEEAKDVKPLLKYPEDTAGGIMQTELVKVSQNSTVRDTINWIRLIADEVEDFQLVFVTDNQDKLLGQISLTKLILATASTNVTAIMEPIEVTTTPYIDQEEVVKIFQKYDILSLPVVDSSGVLLGRITADDVLDVLSEEASEDLFQMAGVGDSLHPIYTPTRTRILLRAPWLLLTLIGELFIAFIIVYAFQPTLEKVAILAAFMPAIMATGGNVGLQTTTIIIRSLGMGTINVKQMFKLVISEMKVGLSLGLICGIIAALIGALISYNQPEVTRLALAVFIAMVSATLATSFIGVAAPLVLHKLDFDPAAASGPFLTMFNDIFGSVFYLFIAMLIL
ncbi:MAG: magnesium transporter MgtE [Thermodesulfobacteriota bacterium]|nr:MAG: magnesium transporter MgtE [Thermodesulfobacteriota bacterium]